MSTGYLIVTYSLRAHVRCKRFTNTLLHYKFQNKAIKDKFKAMRINVSNVFDDLHHCVEMRRQVINRQIKTEEAAAMASLTQLDTERAVMTSHAVTVEQLVASAPDDALLEMLSDLTSRLNDLELQTGTKDKMETVYDVTFDSDKLTQLKSAIAELGRYYSVI